MTVSGKICERDWSVSVDLVRKPEGFVPAIHVVHIAPDETFEYRFNHHKAFRTEREAVLEGLREGMNWIGQKMANAFSFHAHP
jgi:hypothetical protein